ncbi:MAG TPA: caspase family protein, partial [Polyangiaceae bacterium]|nr:caspase family protein [Polyangiaceae bacterium]
SKLLLDSEVTVESVRAALAELAQMRPHDLAVVFLAGHGVRRSAEGEMVFLTSSADMDSKGLLANGVGWSELGQALARAKGRVLVLLDACHSGVVSQELLAPNGSLASALVRDQRAGALVFAAAKGRQFSYEAGNTRGLVLDMTTTKLVGGESTSQGYFTGALLQALRAPDTDRNGDGLLQASELIDDVSARVVTATDGMQTPWVARREMFGDFTLGKAVSGHAQSN